MEDDNLLEYKILQWKKGMEKVAGDKHKIPQLKRMEKVSHECVLDNFSIWSKMQIGSSFQSDSVDVGVFQFRIVIYPRGKTEDAQKDGMMSVCIRNDSELQAEVVYSFGIPQTFGLPFLELRRSMFRDRGLFRRVITVAPSEEVGIMQFLKLSKIKGLSHNYIWRDSIRLKVTIGVFVTFQPQVPRSLDRIIFFQVEDKQYYAEELIIRRRCPTLVSNDSEFPNFKLQNITPDTFDALLWFIYNKELYFRDKEDICACDLSDPNSLGVRLLVASRLSHFDFLKETCESIIFYGCLELHDYIFPIKRGLRRARRLLCWQQTH